MEAKRLLLLPSRGTTIREAVSSDPSKVTVEIVNKLKVRVTAVGAVGKMQTLLSIVIRGLWGR